MEELPPLQGMEDLLFSSQLIPSLPNDVSLQILAMTPLSSHATLSVVSRSWRCHLRSPIFYSLRSDLNARDYLLFVAIRIHDSSMRWFVLSPESRVLSRIPPIPSSAVGSACVVLDTSIYVIGGSVNEIPTPAVWVFDARLGQWAQGPHMNVPREFAVAGVLDSRIYVVGGCLVDTWARSPCWAEMFDPKVGSWSPVPSPLEIRERWMHGSAVLDGKVFAVADRGGVVFDPKNSMWGTIPTGLDLGWRGRAAVVHGVLFSYDFLGKIRGYDAEEDKWEELEGIDIKLPKFLCGAALTSMGGRLCVVWEGKRKGKDMDILCSMIEVCRGSNGQLRGSVVWCNVIFTLSAGSSVVHCLSVVL